MANVNVSYEDMQHQAASLRSEQNEIDARLHGLQVAVQNLVGAGFVTDAASGQFAASYESFDRGAKQTIEGLAGMADYLDRAATAFQSLDGELARAIG